MQNKHIGFLFVFAWVVFAAIIFDLFGYEINEFNSSLRVFLVSGKADVRSFDENGIPLSYNAKTKEKYISPFYVVHYGLIYSDEARTSGRRSGFHWKKDASVKFWNVSPSVVKEEYFKFAADWVVDNLVEFHGQKHLLYNFDWEYKNYPNGKLSAPWWSGLSDAYAIILLLRAHDVYGDEKYFVAATELYRSVLTPVSLGGSLVDLNGLPWIEEYVDFRVAPERMSKVLNGMIYAFYGVNAFENHPKGFGSSSNKLRESIVKNFETFSMGRWSLYDSIGNAANIKYHRIHVALLSDFLNESDVALNDLHKMWAIGSGHPGFFWLINADWSYAKLHFFLSWAFVTLLGAGVIFRLFFRRRLVS